MGRRGPKVDATTPAQQLEEFAFNTFGWAMEVPEKDDMDFTKLIIINAYEPSGTPYEKALQSMKNKAEKSYRESLTLTPRESEPDSEAGVLQYLLIGFALMNLPDQAFKKHLQLKKQQPVGTNVLDEGILGYDKAEQRIPLMVVTPMQDAETQKTDLYVLLRPRLGLCTPYHIGQKECFYLAAYRDGTTDLKKRGPAWNQIVAGHAAKPLEQALSLKQETYKKARNTSKIVLDEKVSLINEVCCLAECFAKGGEMWHLKELAAVLEHADEDLIYTPAASNTAMRKFVDNEQEFEEGDAAQLLGELSELWPDLQGIGTADLSTLKEQVVRDDLILEYRLIRPFISEACFQLQSLREKNEGGLLKVAEQTLATVRRILGSHESAAPIMTPPTESLLIPALLSALKDILNAAKVFEKQLKDSCGDQTMTGTLQDVWEKFAEALDTDAAKKSWFEAVRYLVAAQQHKQRGVTEAIKDVVELLEEMHLSPGKDTKKGAKGGAKA